MYKKIIIVLIALLAISCNEEQQTEPKSNSSMLSSVLPPDPIFDDLVAQYDTTDITGLIQIGYNHIDYFDLEQPDLAPDSISEANNIESYRSQAFFFNGNLGNQFTIDSLIWEGNSFEQHSTSGDIMYLLTDMKNTILWNDSNHVKLDSNANIVGFDENIFLSDKPRFTNISKGDTLNKLNNLNISWSGASDHYARLSFNSRSSSSNDGIMIFTDDDGNHSFSSSDISSFNDGIYILTLHKYEPHFIDLSDGKKVCILVTTETSISVYLD